MINSGDYDLNVTDLKFIRGVDDKTDDFYGDRVSRNTVPAGDCFRISLQGKQNEKPPQCASVQSAEFLTNQLRFFWRKEAQDNTTISTFEVQYKGSVVARCDTVVRGADTECRFTWPVPPPTAEPAG
jgi:hypothetical protein